MKKIPTTRNRKSQKEGGGIKSQWFEDQCVRVIKHARFLEFAEKLLKGGKVEVHKNSDGNIFYGEATADTKKKYAELLLSYGFGLPIQRVSGANGVPLVIERVSYVPSTGRTKC